MGKHISDSLYSPCCHIMSSDEDQPIVMDIYVGFNIFGQLVVCVWICMIMMSLNTIVPQQQ